MSTVTATTPGTRFGGNPAVTPSRVVVAEWIKLRSLRSTWFSLGAALLVTIGLGILVADLRGNDIAQHGGYAKDMDFIRLSLSGTLLAQLAVGVLGVLMITGEYATGMIRASLSAVPRRGPVLLAKVVVLGGTTLVLGTIAGLIAFSGGQAALSVHHYGSSLSSPGALRAVVGAGVYLALIALLGLGLGFIFRSTGGALAALFGLLLVLPLLAQALPQPLQDNVSKVLPLNAGIQVMATQSRGSNVLAPLTGILVLALYVVGALGVGWIMLRRRDA